MCPLGRCPAASGTGSACQSDDSAGIDASDSQRAGRRSGQGTLATPCVDALARWAGTYRAVPVGSRPACQGGLVHEQVTLMMEGVGSRPACQGSAAPACIDAAGHPAARLTYLSDSSGGRWAAGARAHASFSVVKKSQAFQRHGGRLPTSRLSVRTCRDSAGQSELDPESQALPLYPWPDNTSTD